MGTEGTVPVFRPDVALEDAIGTRVFAPCEALPRVRPMACLAGVSFFTGWHGTFRPNTAGHLSEKFTNAVVDSAVAKGAVPGASDLDAVCGALPSLAASPP
jgi:hypothetical protein